MFLLNDRHLERALKRHYRRMKPKDANRAAVAHFVADDADRAELRQNLEDQIDQGKMAAPGDSAHPILAQLIQWLEANWMTILEEILKLFGH